MEDYYSGSDGAKRLIAELDHLLQRMINAVGDAEALHCSIELRLKGGESVSLERQYQARLRTGEGTA